MLSGLFKRRAAPPPPPVAENPVPQAWPPGHFYSPLASPEDVAAGLRTPSELRGLDLHDEDQPAFLAEIAALLPRLRFPETRTPGRRYFYDNGSFAALDAVCLATMLARFRARRVIEPGSVLWGTGGTRDLADIVERGREGIARLDVAAMAAANQEFHRTIVARSGSERLNTMMERILAEMRLIFYGMSSDQTFHQPYIEYNAEIVTYLERGDNAVAADVLTHYLAKAEAQLLESATVETVEQVAEPVSR